MSKLIYLINTSLDGYVADRDGNFAFHLPTPEVFSALLEVIRPAKTYLYGRRMYEVMAPWETAHVTPDTPNFIPSLGTLERDFATVWRAASKLVISSTLATPMTERTRIAPSLDLDAIRAVLRDGDATVGGPHLAGALMAADLVDDFHAFVCPVSLGGGQPWLPRDLRLSLALVGERRLGNVVHLHYTRR